VKFFILYLVVFRRPGAWRSPSPQVEALPEDNSQSAGFDP